MASNFPTSLDSFTNPLSGDKLDSPSHSTQHANANDAIESLETKIGIGASPAGSATAGYAFVHSSGGTTAWSQVGYQGITSGTATSGQVLTASTGGTTTWSTPSAAGLIQIVPSSVAVGSGSASVSSNGEVSFSAVSSVSLNDVFSSTYLNYLVLFTATTTNAATADMFMRLRVSGTDASANNYSGYFTGINSASGAFNYVANGVSNWTFTAQHSSLTQGYNVARVEIFNPNLANPTEFTAQTLGVSSAGQFFSWAGAGLHDVATAYTGLSWLKSTGTMTGKVSVYGFRS